MAKRKIGRQMTDKERILMTIISELSFTQTLAYPPFAAKFKQWFPGGYERELVHFESSMLSKTDLQEGQLVLCRTASMFPWKVAFIHKVIDNHTCVLREIGTDRLCNMGNEDFQVIAGMQTQQLWEREQYQFSIKVKKAFIKGNDMWYLFGGVDFKPDQIAIIWVRARYGGMLQFKHVGAKPFPINIKWNKKITITQILATMREQGYGTHQWEPNDPPAQQVE